MTTLICIGLYLAGIISGVLIMRYGLGLGVKLAYQIKNDFPPLDGAGQPSDQETTQEE